MSKCISDVFLPNFDNYNKVLITEDCLINDLNFINNVAKEQGKLFFESMQIDSKRDFDIPSDSCYNEDLVFGSFVPQHLDTVGELSEYYDYIDNLDINDE